MIVHHEVNGPTEGMPAKGGNRNSEAHNKVIYIGSNIDNYNYTFYP